MLLNILPHFLLQNFFSYFPLLQPKCVFWSEKYGIWQHLPLQGAVGPVLCTWLQRSQSANLWPSRLSAVAWSKLAGGGIAIWFHMYLKVWWFCFLKQGYFSIFFLFLSQGLEIDILKIMRNPRRGYNFIWNGTVVSSQVTCCWNYTAMCEILYWNK